MATISFNLPAPVVNRVLDAIATRHGYTGFLPDGVTPQTKTDFFKAYVILVVKRDIKEHEGNTIAQTAITTNNTDVDNNIIIT